MDFGSHHIAKQPTNRPHPSSHNASSMPSRIRRCNTHPSRSIAPYPTSHRLSLHHENSTDRTIDNTALMSISLTPLTPNVDSPSESQPTENLSYLESRMLTFINSKNRSMCLLADPFCLHDYQTLIAVPLKRNESLSGQMTIFILKKRTSLCNIYYY